MWSKVSNYRSKLAIQQERKAKTASSSGFSPSIPVPLCELSSVVECVCVTTAPCTMFCSVTISTFSLIVLAAVFVSFGMLFADEPNRKVEKGGQQGYDAF